MKIWISGAFDSIFNSLNDLLNFENGLCGEIKYSPPKTEEPTPPKSPKGKGSAKGKKSPKPKSAGKKGKKSKTPDEDKGPDPVLAAKTEAGFQIDALSSASDWSTFKKGFQKGI